MKENIQKALGVILGLYFFTIMIFAPYYNWKYATTHGFLKWVLFGEIVATAKAVVWPYFVFISVSPESTISHFSKAIDYANKATAIINKGGAYQLLSQSDVEEIVGYYKKALAEAKEADIKSMNQYYPEFGDHFKSEFIKGLELAIQSYEKRDAMISISAHTLLNEWGDWYQSNIEGIRSR